MNAIAAQRLKSLITHILLLIGVAISIFPFYWMAVMASRTTGDIFKFPPTLTPHWRRWSACALRGRTGNGGSDMVTAEKLVHPRDSLSNRLISRSRFSRDSRLIQNIPFN